jgi:hypothetical protein
MTCGYIDLKRRRTGRTRGPCSPRAPPRWRPFPVWLVSSSHVPAVLSNLRITVARSPQGNPAGEIYDKVVDATAGTPGLARIRFTSTTPELKAWVTAWTRREAIHGELLKLGERSRSRRCRPVS